VVAPESKTAPSRNRTKKPDPRQGSAGTAGVRFRFCWTRPAQKNHESGPRGNRELSRVPDLGQSWFGRERLAQDPRPD
jgi:hypothetical protein